MIKLHDIKYQLKAIKYIKDQIAKGDWRWAPALTVAKIELERLMDAKCNHNN